MTRRLTKSLLKDVKTLLEESSTSPSDVLIKPAKKERKSPKKTFFELAIYKGEWAFRRAFNEAKRIVRERLQEEEDETYIAEMRRDHIRRDYEEETERKLWLAVLLQAWKDALRARSNKIISPAEKSSAINWFMDNTMYYRKVCEHAGMCPDKVRRAFKSKVLNIKS